MHNKSADRISLSKVLIFIKYIVSSSLFNLQQKDIFKPTLKMNLVKISNIFNLNLSLKHQIIEIIPHRIMAVHKI
jgi:hypothetical protein